MNKCFVQCGDEVEREVSECGSESGQDRHSVCAADEDQGVFRDAGLQRAQRANCALRGNTQRFHQRRKLPAAKISLSF